MDWVALSSFASDMTAAHLCPSFSGRGFLSPLYLLNYLSGWLAGLSGVFFLVFLKAQLKC